MRLLHITFHKGCELEIEYVFKTLGHELEVMYFDDAADVIAESDDKVLVWTGGILAAASSPLGYFAIPVLGVWTAVAAKALF